EPRLDDAGHESRELGRRPAGICRQLGVDEVEPIERMTLVLDAAVHVRAAARACIALNHRVAVDDLQLLLYGGDLDLVARDDCDHRKNRARGLPALGAAANMIVSSL